MKDFFKRNKHNILYNILCSLVVWSTLLLFYFSSGFSSYGRQEQLADKLAKESLVTDIKSTNILIKGTTKKDSIDPIFYTRVCSSKNGLLYNTFPLQNALSFNGLKDHECDILDLEESGKNVTAVISSIFSNHYDKKERIILDTYYVELMFKSGVSDRSNVDNFCYISNLQADYLMSKNNLNDYSDLLGFVLSCQIDGAIYKWKIGNIFYESGSFCNSCSSLFGNYIISYIGTPYNEIEFIQSFQQNTVHNINKIQELNNAFPNSDYTYYSLNNADIVCDKLNGNFISSTVVISIVLAIIGVISLLLSIAYVIWKKKYESTMFLSVVSISSIILFFTLFFSSLVAKSVFLFTTVSLAVNAGVTIVSLIILLFRFAGRRF